MNKEKLFEIFGIVILAISLICLAFFAGKDIGSWVSVGALAIAGVSVLGAGRLVRNQHLSDEM